MNTRHPYVGLEAILNFVNGPVAGVVVSVDTDGNVTLLTDEGDHRVGTITQLVLENPKMAQQCLITGCSSHELREGPDQHRPLPA